MSRNDRRHGKNRSWNNRDNNERNDRSERKNHESRGSGSYERRQERRHFVNPINQKEIEENRNAIRAFKENVVTCEVCGQPIADIANAITNRGSGKPVHFDCVITKLAEEEKLEQNDKISYIGQGRFGVLHFDNPHDQKHFTIKKIIEWEARDSERGDWRNEMAGLFSQVK
ncbi:MAG: hypothetical protein K5873_09285 [Treponema sp.]|nr:hypothetical protein [Treponema sp.]